MMACWLACPRRWLLWACLLLPWWAPLHEAQASTQALVLRPTMAQASLAGHLARHADAGGQQTLAEVVAEGAFTPLPGFGGDGYIADAIWYRFTLSRESAAPADWILELGPPFLDDIRVYLPQAGGGWQETRLGDHQPYGQRPLQTRLHTVGLSLPPAQDMTIYVRLQSISALAFHARLWQPRAFMAKETQGNYFQGVFFGMLLLTIVMYSILGAWLRDVGLLSYVTYVLTLFFLYLGLSGYGAMLFAPDDGRWLDAMTGLGAIGGGIAGVLMWGRYLDLRRHFPRIHLFVLACVALMVPSLFSVASPAYRLLAPLAIPLSIGLTWMFTGLLVWRIVREPRQPLLWFYLAAFLPGTMGLAVHYAMTVGSLPLNAFTSNGFQIGSLVHVLVLNLALAWRVRQMQKDKLVAEHEALAATAKAADQRQLNAMLSHEFRNPLAAISRSAQLAMLKLDGQESARLQSIRDNADALYALVDKFLVTESLDYKSTLTTRRRTRLHTLIADAVRGLNAETRTRVTVTPPEASFKLDRQLFALALGNLLDNALRYSPSDSPVTVQAQMQGPGLRIEITDQGAGMSADEVARLGTPYFRSETALRMRGVGLGFLLARKIVEAHGGSLTVHSTVGQGTRIDICL